MKRNVILKIATKEMSKSFVSAQFQICHRGFVSLKRCKVDHRFRVETHSIGRKKPHERCILAIFLTLDCTDDMEHLDVVDFVSERPLDSSYNDISI